MAKHEFMPAFMTNSEFERFSTFISLMARGRRGDVAARLGVSKQTLYRLSADAQARVRSATRKAIEQLLAESAGIRLTSSARAPEENKQTPDEPAVTKQVEAAAPCGEKLLAHLRDALIEAAASCKDAAKLTKALAELL